RATATVCAGISGSPFGCNDICSTPCGPRRDQGHRSDHAAPATLTQSNYAAESKVRAKTSPGRVMKKTNAIRPLCGSGVATLDVRWHEPSIRRHTTSRADTSSLAITHQHLQIELNNLANNKAK
ncbi:hypothetical protein, partial [Streptomyces sp. NPDC087437]|uniref:hypothetical protein n=1 Tax=Streptomyces sp. NPDC087437 TaxID=3365789 RepID=UPI003818E02D